MKFPSTMVQVDECYLSYDHIPDYVKLEIPWNARRLETKNVSHVITFFLGGFGFIRNMFDRVTQKSQLHGDTCSAALRLSLLQTFNRKGRQLNTR